MFQNWLLGKNFVDAIESLLTRQSNGVLEDPGPSNEELDIMFKAACQAPDHCGLTPWRFIVIRGEARQMLGSLFVKSVQNRNHRMSEETKEKFQNLPLTAPLLIAVVCCEKEHARVPKVELYLSLGAAVGNILLAAHAQDLGAMWRTGDVSYCPIVSGGLGLVTTEKLCGFVYLGKIKSKKNRTNRPLYNEIVTTWQGV